MQKLLKWRDHFLCLFHRGRQYFREVDVLHLHSFPLSLWPLLPPLSIWWQPSFQPYGQHFSPVRKSAPQERERLLRPRPSPSLSLWANGCSMPLKRSWRKMEKGGVCVCMHMCGAVCLLKHLTSADAFFLVLLQELKLLLRNQFWGHSYENNSVLKYRMILKLDFL